MKKLGKGMKILLISICAVFIFGALAAAFDIIKFDEIGDKVSSWFEKEEPSEDPLPDKDNGNGSGDDMFESAILVCEESARQYLVVTDGNGSEVKPFNANGMYFIDTTNIYTLSALEGKTLKITLNSTEAEFSAAAPYQFRAAALDDKITVSLVSSAEAPDDGDGDDNSDLTPGGDEDNTFCTVIYMDDSAFDSCQFVAPDGYDGDSITPTYVNKINVGMPISIHVPSETIYISETGFGVVDGATVVSGIDTWNVSSAEEGKSYYIWLAGAEDLGVPSNAEAQEIFFEPASSRVMMYISNEAYYSGGINIYEGSDISGTKISLDEGYTLLKSGQAYTFESESGTFYIDICCPNGSIPCTDAIVINEGTTYTYIPEGDFALHVDAASEASTMSLRDSATSSAVPASDAYDDTNGISYSDSDIVSTDKGWSDFY